MCECERERNAPEAGTGLQLRSERSYPEKFAALHGPLLRPPEESRAGSGAALALDRVRADRFLLSSQSIFKDCPY